MRQSAIRCIRTMRKHVQIVLFFLCASIGGFLDFSLLYSLTEFLGLHYLISAAAGYVVGTTTNYYLHRRVTFSNKSERIKTQFTVFIIAGSVGLGIHHLSLYLIVEYLGLWYITSKVFASVLMVLYNYSAHKAITFNIFR